MNIKIKINTTINIDTDTDIIGKKSGFGFHSDNCSQGRGQCWPTDNYRGSGQGSGGRNKKKNYYEDNQLKRRKIIRPRTHTNLEAPSYYKAWFTVHYIDTSGKMHTFPAKTITLTSYSITCSREDTLSTPYTNI